jgi:hypothetical protein
LSASNLQKYQNIPYGICTDYPAKLA